MLNMFLYVKGYFMEKMNKKIKKQKKKIKTRIKIKRMKKEVLLKKQNGKIKVMN